jgi:hypothetical protein
MPLLAVDDSGEDVNQLINFEEVGILIAKKK